MKTRPATSRDFTCPCHRLTVKHQVRRPVDKETGERRYGGEYLACPQYAECKWYISFSRGRATCPTAYDKE